MNPSVGLDPAFSVEGPASKVGVMAAIAESQGIASGRGPPWLRDSQIGPFRQGLAAVRRFGGTMLAMPVGTGKTYVALAIARVVAASTTTTAVVPAVLVRQWRGVAASLGIPIEIASHESVSRGHAPTGPGPVIIDESHRFREPSSRRYRTIAPVLLGRPIVLATATPVVNRLDDLVAQLLLAVRDDVLAHRGLESLQGIIAAGAPVAGLDELVIRQGGNGAEGQMGGGADGQTGGSLGLPTRRPSRIRPVSEPAFERVLAAVDGLGCARDHGVAAVIRIGLLRALGSSPAALRASLGRYRRLLDHAARAHHAGHPLSRRAIFSAIGADPEQLVLWELLPGAENHGADIALGDRRRLGPLCRMLRRWSNRGDGKLGQLRALLDDRRSTIVFATSVETVRYLRDHLGHRGTAWITGSGAGIGLGKASRATVLAAFDPSDPGWPATVPRPWLLLASDVAAEGLNLQRVNRIVHYDLPWTAVRLAQRDGRAIRMGSTHESVEVVRFDLPEALEQRIAVERAIERKARLLATAGLDGRQTVGSRFWREGWSVTVPTPGWVVLRADVAGALAAVTARSAAVLLKRGVDGQWSRVGSELDELLSQCERAAEVSATSIPIEPIVASLAGPIADWLTELELGLPFSPRAGRRSALRATRIRGAELWRARRSRELEEVGQVQRFLSRGHSAGEALLARAVATGDQIALAQAARLGDCGGASSSAIATLVALVVFRPDPG